MLNTDNDKQITHLQSPRILSKVPNLLLHKYSCVSSPQLHLSYALCSTLALASYQALTRDSSSHSHSALDVSPVLSSAALILLSEPPIPLCFSFAPQKSCGASNGQRGCCYSKSPAVVELLPIGGHGSTLLERQRTGMICVMLGSLNLFERTAYGTPSARLLLVNPSSRTDRARSAVLRAMTKNGRNLLDVVGEDEDAAR
ncbi:cytochrome P450 [Striga asiatica]|uniref:Cytochrome P450 n=1 Tax=Striga asiatica TaxID=4170 RepID=A0A5A7PRY1_STRAF|nr:cytochrome P450 [Striga asiatica]